MSRWTLAAAAAAAVALGSLAACGGQGGGDDTTAAAKEQQAQQAEQDERAVSVRLALARTTAMQPWIYSQGTARATRREFLTFTAQGQVTHLDRALRIGSPVRAGQVIAYQAQERVRAELTAAQAGLKEAEADLALARVTLQRYETLIAQQSASKQELDQARVQVEQAVAARDSARAQIAQAQLGVDESRLVSPIRGVLARLNIEQGRYFSPQTVQTGSEQDALRSIPALVIDPSRFEVRVDLPSFNFRDIEVGARVIVGGVAPQGGDAIDPEAQAERVQGVVHAVSPSLDPETRTFEIIVRTTDPSPRLQDGQFVAVWIAQPLQQDALAVPADALRHRNDQAFVFVYDADRQRVVERRVELGQQAGNDRAVSAGLKAGDQIVTDGRARLVDGQRVRVLDDAQPPAEPPPAAAPAAGASS